MPRPPTSPAVPPSRGPRVIGRGVWTLGLLFILTACVASGALVAQHLFNISLPGCSSGSAPAASGTSITGAAPSAQAPSACASLEAHPLGSLGGMWIGLQSKLNGNPVPKITMDQAYWPVSFLGFAYFFGALVAWIIIARRARIIPAPVRALVWLGVSISLAYLIVIVIERKFCQYCITSHSANLALVLCMEIGMFLSARRASRSSASHVPSSRSIIAGALGGFLVVSAALGGLESSRRSRVAAEAAAEAKRSDDALKAKIAADAAKAKQQAEDAEKNPWPTGFKARWTLGPEKAPVRVVILSSYQCPDCKRIEGEAFQLLAKYKDQLSVGFMHFPLCPDCNKYVSKEGHIPHPNACWAARAAETAGMLQGPDGFWKMHKWLFEKNGSFTNDEIRAGIKSLGFDEAMFMKLMQESPLPDTNIGQDVDVGHKLGLYFTPLIFINGVEMRGWNVPGALVRAVDAAMAQNPPALTAAVDSPPLASQKYIDDWKVMPVMGLPIERTGRSIGPADALVKVTIFADYAEPNSKEAWTILSALAKDPANSVRVTYRHFPGDMECNPKLPKTFFANGCLAARAAEAAGMVHADDGYWKLHEWLYAFPDKSKLSINEIKRGANALGLDSGKIESILEAAGSAKLVEQDITAAQSSGVTQIPQIFVNGKFVQRWVRENDNVMQRIVDEARKEQQDQKSQKAPGK